MSSQKQPATLVSREVIRRQRPSIDVTTSALTYAADVALSLEPLLAQGLPEGATMPDTEVLQLSVGNLVTLYEDAMESADDAHFTSNSELNRLRLVRDDTHDRLYPKLAEIRDTFDAAYGVGTCQRILGIGVRIPKDPLTVRRMTARVVARLTAVDFEPPPRRDDGIAVDIAAWVAALSPDLELLKSSLGGIARAKRQVVRTQEAKNQAVEEFERIYGRCSRFLEALYDVAGRDYLALRLRPSSHSKGKPSDDDSSSGGSSNQGGSSGEGDPSNDGRTSTEGDSQTEPPPDDSTPSDESTSGDDSSPDDPAPDEPSADDPALRPPADNH